MHRRRLALVFVTGIVAAATLTGVGTASARSGGAAVSTTQAVAGLSSHVLQLQTPLHVQLSSTRLARHTKLVGAAVDFGDGTGPVIEHSLSASASHRYARPGAYTVTVGVTDSTGFTARAVARVVVASQHGVKAKPTTLTVPRARLVSAAHPSKSTEVLVIRGGRSPHVGGDVVVPAGGAILPAGLVARVTAVAKAPHAMIRVFTRTVSLADAYAKFSVSLNQGASPLHLVHTSKAQEGLAASVASTSTPFACDASGTHSITATADFSHSRVTGDLDIATRSMDLLFGSDPVITLDTAFSGQAHCHLAGDLALGITVALDPPLTLTIKPDFTLDASGQVQTHTVWKPRLLLGFQRAPGVSSDTHLFNGTDLTTTGSGNAQLTLYDGIQLNLSAAGVVGVAVDAGPEITTVVSGYSGPAANTGCVTVTADLKATLTANVNTFFKSYTFTLFAGQFLNATLYHQCFSSPPVGTPPPVNPAPPGNPVPPVTTSPPGNPAPAPTTPVTPAPPGAPADRFAVVSYDQLRAGAQHAQWVEAWQPFVAASNTITQLSINVGSTDYPAGAPSGVNTTLLLCTDANCTTVIGSGVAQVVNYGATTADIGDVGVTPGATYYLRYDRPDRSSHWAVYFWGPGTYDTLSATVRGYNR